MTATDDRTTTAGQPENPRTADLLANRPKAPAHTLNWRTSVSEDGEYTYTRTNLGSFTLGDTTWDIRACVDAERYTWDDQDLAAMPFLIRGPGLNVIEYPMPTANVPWVEGLLFHAPYYIAYRFPAEVPALVWEQRNGRTFAHVTTVTDQHGRVDVIAFVGRVRKYPVSTGWTSGENGPEDRTVTVGVADTSVGAGHVLAEVAKYVSRSPMW